MLYSANSRTDIQRWLCCAKLINGTVGQLQMINGCHMEHSALVLIKDSSSTVQGAIMSPALFYLLNFKELLYNI